MTEWKEYTGSDEQITEITQCKTDVLFEFPSGKSRLKSEMFMGDWRNCVITKYMICNPHPLADMICQQARTGQPVWARKLFECGIEKEWQMFVTTTPDWNIPNAEYSFTEFKDDRDRPEPSFHGDAI